MSTWFFCYVFHVDMKNAWCFSCRHEKHMTFFMASPWSYFFLEPIRATLRRNYVVPQFKKKPWILWELRAGLSIYVRIRWMLVLLIALFPLILFKFYTSITLINILLGTFLVLLVAFKSYTCIIIPILFITTITSISVITILVFRDFYRAITITTISVTSFITSASYRF